MLMLVLWLLLPLVVLSSLMLFCACLSAPTSASAGELTIAAAGGNADGGDGAMVAAAAARTEGILLGARPS